MASPGAARNQIDVKAPPDAVYAVLTDASAYAEWVVGAKEIRAVDRGWPRAGKQFHHTIGVGPATVEDTSKILETLPNRRLVLEARFRPIGVAHVVVELEPRRRGNHTRVTMFEYPTAGPARKLWSRPLGALTRVRNAASLRRLRRLAEAREY